LTGQARAVVVAWLAFIFLDRSALTAGTVQAADPALRGATMGLHSICGYAAASSVRSALAWRWTWPGRTLS